MIVTFSWDDGHPLNLKLLSILNKYDLKATFYITGDYLVDDKNRSEVLKIAKNQEIGAHTFSHPKLTKINLSQAGEEIKSGKEKLENILGQTMEMFSYPYGFFNSEIKEQVKLAEFLGARTTERFVISQPNDFFEFGTTFQVYPHPFRKRDAKHLHGPKVILQPLKTNFGAIRQFHLPFNSFFNWFDLNKNLFDYCYKYGEIFHLWGHSWEIEKYAMWPSLERFFQYIKNFQDIMYLTNGESLKYFKNEHTFNKSK